ncbi:MAG: PEP-CTERM sorting domain-containing protein [Luteolibacter sp.]
MRTTFLLGLIAGTSALVGNAHAATITWGSATSVTTVTADVSNTGTTVEAFNAAADTVSNTLNLNGVSFTSTGALLNNSNGVDAFSGTTGNADYDQFLSNIDFGNGGNLVSLTIGGGLLVNGGQYLLQVWYADTNNATRVMQFGDGNSNTVNLVATGQYATGTFTADGSSQTLTLDAQGFGNAHITGYQLRAIPEPSAAALLGLGGLGLILRRRR